jgi:hypothetical protein
MAISWQPNHLIEVIVLIHFVDEIELQILYICVSDIAGLVVQEAD